MMNADMIAPLRRYDYERYLCCLFEKAAVQPRLWALLLLNLELAKVAESTSEEAVGAIRLKWWQEALQKIAAGEQPQEHPLLPLLAEHCMPEVAQLEPIVEARLMDVSARKGFANMAQFEQYLQQTAGQLHWVISGADEHKELIVQAGIFYGLVGSLRAMPYYLERGIVRQPLDVLLRYGIAPEAVQRGVEKEAFAELMQFWLEEISRRAQALRAPINALPKEYALIKRLHCSALLYAKALMHVDGDISALPPQLPMLGVKLCWCQWFSLPKLGERK